MSAHGGNPIRRKLGLDDPNVVHDLAAALKDVFGGVVARDAEVIAAFAADYLTNRGVVLDQQSGIL